MAELVILAFKKAYFMNSIRRMESNPSFLKILYDLPDL